MLSKRLCHSQQDDQNEKDGGNFIQPAIKKGRMPVFAPAKRPQQPAQVAMEGQQQQHQPQLEVQPAGMQPAGHEGDQPQPKSQGEQGTWGHDAPKKPFFHEDETVQADSVPGCGVVNIQPGQVKKPGKPGDHENDMKGLDPEHRQGIPGCCCIVHIMYNLAGNRQALGVLHMSESSPLLQVTQAAASKVLSLMREEENPALKLRVYVTGGGCSGFQYGFSFEETIAEGDEMVITTVSSEAVQEEEEEGGAETGGRVSLLVDPVSAQYLAGAEIDYREDIEGAQFIIKNPNAQTTCGCGSSFSV